MGMLFWSKIHKSVVQLQADEAFSLQHSREKEYADVRGSREIPTSNLLACCSRKAIKCLLSCTICGLLMACSSDSLPKEDMHLVSQDKVLAKCMNHAIAASREKMAGRVLRRTIDEYMISFIELYTANTFEGGDIGIEIKEVEIYMDSGSALLTQYSDKQGKCLRYKIVMYGETMDTIINYYLCNGFVLVSKQSDYYSNRLASIDGLDILCSKIENWIIYDNTIYMLHDYGELEIIDDDHMPFLLLGEIDELMKSGEDAEVEGERAPFASSK